MSIQNPNVAEKVLCPIDDTAASPSIQFGGPTNEQSGTGIRGNLTSMNVSVAGADVLTIDANGLAPSQLLVPSAAPAAADDPGVAGTVTWDANYIYVCVATDTWVRAALSTWP